ncbi:MAG: hypothetical protein H7249_01145 [Chitinophagaceae bacterium]|nr:hypothetical protein [Oligoflexus sp.]
MTQTASGHLQFDRLEHDLENWRDQLTQISPYLSQADLARLARRWDIMRQNLDSVFLNYGRPLTHLSVAMDPLPALMDLHQDELELAIEALAIAKKNLNLFMAESEAHVPLLEQALNIDENPARIRRCLEKMRVIDEGFQTRLQNIITYVHQFNTALASEDSLSQTTQKVMEQTRRIEGLRNANAALASQKQEMAQWLNDSKQRLMQTPSTPAPSPNAIGLVSQSFAPRTEADHALQMLFTNREKIREASRYLENVLAAEKENPK